MAGYTAQVKLTWKRELNDENYYYHNLYLQIGKYKTWVAEVSQWWATADTYNVWLCLDNSGVATHEPKEFKTVDDAKAYTEKRVIKYFGLKENTDV